MKVTIWRGYHDQKLPKVIKDSWEKNDLLILCPPHLKDYSFVEFLPKGSNVFFGGDDFSGLEEKIPQQISQQEFGADKPVLGVFTSGTISGTSKLILYSKKNIINSLDGILSVFDKPKITSIFCYPQPTHTFGLLLGYVMSLINKVPLIFTEGKYSHLSHVNRVSIKDPGLLTLGTPTHFYDLLNYVKKNNIKMAPSYSCIIGGAPVTVSIWNQIQKELRILNPSIGYGCTEASPGITHHPPGLKPLEDGEIGFPLKSIEPRISKGVVIKGPSLCLAIIQDRKIYFPEEFLVSDQIRIRSDGMWIYEGRLDLMVNRGGQKISLEVIEKILFNELGLEVACSSVDDKRLGKDIGILVKAPPEKEIIKKINDKLWEKLGFSISEKKILNVVDFPLNENLKLDRRGVGRFIEGYLDG